MHATDRSALYLLMHPILCENHDDDVSLLCLKWNKKKKNSEKGITKTEILCSKGLKEDEIKI